MTTDPPSDADLPYLTVEYLNANSRARYDNTEQMFSPTGWVWRFPEDPDYIWRMCFNDTRLKRPAPTEH